MFALPAFAMDQGRGGVAVDATNCWDLDGEIVVGDVQLKLKAFDGFRGWLLEDGIISFCWSHHCQQGWP